jgi:hypothetical protein
MLANVAARGHDGGNKHGMILATVTRGDHGGLGRSSGGGSRASNPNNTYKDHQCQVCGKLGNTTLRS